MGFALNLHINSLQSSAPSLAVPDCLHSLFRVHAHLLDEVRCADGRRTATKRKFAADLFQNCSTDIFTSYLTPAMQWTRQPESRFRNSLMSLHVYWKKTTICFGLFFRLSVAEFERLTWKFVIEGDMFHETVQAYVRESVSAGPGRDCPPPRSWRRWRRCRTCSSATPEWRRWPIRSPQT